ncbi:MAG: hypothetical protein CMJ78_09745 [Planctomycetaceae bacterium]|nr:hypothetical protein [Planctomycetaceae bacterium]
MERPRLEAVVEAPLMKSPPPWPAESKASHIRLFDSAPPEAIGMLVAQLAIYNGVDFAHDVQATIERMVEG